MSFLKDALEKAKRLKELNQGGEQSAADNGLITERQKQANEDMTRQIAEAEKRRQISGERRI